METSNKIYIPKAHNEDTIYKMFMSKVCKDDEIWIDGDQFMINVNYRITDPNYINTEKVIPEKEGLYTESPVLEINNVELFKKTLFEYIKAYTNTNSRWTRPYDNNWIDIATYGMGYIWTDATNQDFADPINFLNRYTKFLTQDQWSDLKNEEEIESFKNVKAWQRIDESECERETPNNYNVFIKDENGKRIYFPSIFYGIEENKAYVYSIQQIHENANKENKEIAFLRNVIKGRGVEPLGIASLICFIQECKKRGIKQIVMPDNFITQYVAKNRLNEEKIACRYRKEDQEAAKIKEEEILDKNYKGSLDHRLMTLFLISKYYSTGMTFMEIPGEVSDNLTVDIQNFKIGREVKKKEDRRNKPRTGEER